MKKEIFILNLLTPTLLLGVAVFAPVDGFPFWRIAAGIFGLLTWGIGAAEIYAHSSRSIGIAMFGSLGVLCLATIYVDSIRGAV